MQKIVIFDMDGTLIDSREDITTSVNYVRQKNHNLPPLEESFVVDAINRHERNLAMLFYNTPTYEERDKVVFEKHYKEQCVQNVYLYEGVLEVLQTFKNKGVKIGVATNAPTKFAVTMLHSLRVDEYFELIVGADKVEHSKPDPAMLQAILKHCHYKEGDKAWMVGDNSKDMQAAHSAGIDAVFAAWGFSSYGEYDVVAQTPQTLLNIVL